MSLWLCGVDEGGGSPGNCWEDYSESLLAAAASGAGEIDDVSFDCYWSLYTPQISIFPLCLA